MKNIAMKILAFLLVFTMICSAVSVFAEEADTTPAAEDTGDVTTGDVTTGDVTTGDVTTGDDTTGDDTTGDGTTGDSTTGDGTTGDGTTGDGTTGDSTTGDGTTGDGTTGDGTTGDSTTGDGTTGDDTPEDAATITYEGDTEDPIEFEADDFSKAYNDATGKTFKSFEIPKLPSTTYGVLYYDYDGEDQEKIIKGEKIKKTWIDDISFVPKKECEITIAIILYGTNSSDPEIEGEIKIIVEEESKTASAISLSGDNGGDAIEFSGSKFNSVCKSATGKNLDYVTFTLPSSTYGILYYDYDGSDEEKVSKSDEFYYDDDPDISDVSFVPKASYSGTVTIKYTGENISGKEFSGTVKIKVSDSDDEDDDDYDVDTVTYTVYNDDELWFEGDDFYDVFDDAGEDFISLEFKTIPSTTYGTLYYDYEGSDEEKIAKGDEFLYDDDPDISDIAFIPKSGKTGTVSITYKGYYTSSKYIEGKISIRIKDADGDDDEDDDDYDVDTVTYSVYNDDELTFDGDDFYDVFDDAGEDLLGIEFKTVPSTTAGVLYYDYDGSDEEKIAKGDEFLYDDDPDISDITFVPKKSYSGTVTITYKGYYTSSKYIEGKITIKVKDADGDDEDEDGDIETINVKVSVDQEVIMNASSLNSAFKKASGKTLSYIKFSIPSASAGTLYYDYDGDDEEKVTSSDKYYYSGTTNALKNVSFVPKKGYTGTVTINYTAYASSTGYPGTIKITYSGESAPAVDTTVNYKGVSDAGIKMGYTEFNDASVRATESPCMSVRFGAVAGGAGALYLYYGEANQTLISAGSTFYTDRKPNITDVTFIPSEGFKGTASISYFGQSNEGDNFTGYVKIEVVEKAQPAAPQKVFADVAETSWYKDIVYKVCGAGLMKGTGDTTFNPEGYMTVAEAITMACRIHNQAKGGADSDFVPTGDMWYTVYVNYAVANGIIKESDFADYNRYVTRAEMAYIFYHSVTPDKLSAMNSWSIPDVSATGKYGAEIYALYNAGILAGNDAEGTFRPESNIIRAEAATILARLAGLVDRVKK
ncbi:MAG: S-layer homology domain-containing protein [Clostridia bacterium]|nr:S-layer homology domain-containing protein [Clostridia bacterium]